MINAAVFLIGFTAMASQIVFIRELLIVFYGNELSIGFIFAGWLIGGGVGSFFFGRSADRSGHEVSLFSLCQISLALMLPISLAGARLVKNILNISTGEIIPFFPMAASGLLILVPVSAILGFLFTLGCRIVSSRGGAKAPAIGKVFVLEALGSILGGLLASFVCMRFMGSFSIIAVIVALNAASAFLLQSVSGEGPLPKSAIRLSAALLLIPAIIMLGSGGWDKIDKWLLAKQWKGYDLLASRNSIYGNIELLKRGDQISFFDNGLHMYTVPDRMVSEESVHYALLEHPAPGSVLLIGGGVGGLAGEILKHPVETVDYVELDPLMVDMARRYLPAQFYRPLEDPRLFIKNTDGRFFVKNAARKYDCVIVSLGDPYTAQINRFYTMEFFKEVKGILNERGVFSCSLTSSDSYINRQLGDYLKSIYATLAKVFADVKIIPGERGVFLASPGMGTLTYDYNVLEGRARERNLDLQYVRDYYLSSKLSRYRTDGAERFMKDLGGVRLNLDFWPSSYYYATLFWASHFRDSLLNIVLTGMREGMIWAGLAVICLSILIFGLISRARPGVDFRRGIGLAVASAGMTGMAFQVIVVIAFQMIYGYVFYKLGIILTAFMLGLSLGGWWMTRRLSVIRHGHIFFIFIQLSLVIYPAVAPFIFKSLAGAQSVFIRWVGSNMIFVALPVIAGSIGGMQFPLANRMLLRGRGGAGAVGGYAYGLDLFGSSLGAIASGALLIPVIGLTNTCLAIALLNSAVLFVLAVNERGIRDG